MMRIAILTLVLGAFVALAACSQKTAPNPPQGAYQNDNTVSNRLDEARARS